jgi:hypothetical protein
MCGRRSRVWTAPAPEWVCFYVGFGGLKTMELLFIAVVLVVAYAVLYAIVRLRRGHR